MEFKELLIAKCIDLISKIDHCSQEENTKQFLITPFIAFLGYDVFNPLEVKLEHKSDFSEKYQNRVDYAIFVNEQPVIAIEAKPVKSLKSDHRGQLKSYFNAQKSIKLAILTDGITYECYTDSDAPNMMDDTPFLRFNLKEISESKIDESTLDGISNLRKVNFSPSNVGAQAKKKLLLSDLVKLLNGWVENPSEGLIKLMLDSVGDNRKKTGKYIEDNLPLIQQAFSAFIDSKLLARVGFADKEVVKILDVPSEIPEKNDVFEEKGIETTETELGVFDYCKRRLAYLVKDESSFNEIESLEFRDFKTHFRVFYKKVEKGVLFNFSVLKDGSFSFIFPKLEKAAVNTNNLQDIDKLLLQSFLKCIEEFCKDAA